MIITEVKDCTRRLVIGYQGENGVREFQFDISGWVALFGQGSAALLLKRSVDPAAYVAATTFNNGILSWVVSGGDVAYPGVGELELRYSVNNQIVKSVVMGTYVISSLGNDVVPPSEWQPFIDQVIEARDDAVEAAADAEDAAKVACAVADMTVSAETLEPGSPATVEKDYDPDTGTLSLTFGIPEGEPGKDGKDGKDGVDGSTPQVSIGTTQTLPAGSAATVSATQSGVDVQLSFGIPKGDTGATGATGQDGATPQVTVGTTTTLPAGSSATVTATQTGANVQLDFGIPEGATQDISGKMDKANPTGTGKVAIGASVSATGTTAVAFGTSTKASGNYSVAEGQSSESTGHHGHAEGYYTRARGNRTHAEGSYTSARGEDQHVQGKYNIPDVGTYADIVGNGTSNSNRKNAFSLDWNGNGAYAGSVRVGATFTRQNADASNETFTISGGREITENLPVIFRICDTMNYSETHTLFCAAMNNGNSTTWADVVAGVENPVVRYVYDDNGTVQFSQSKLLRVNGSNVEAYVYDSAAMVASWKALYTADTFETIVAATDVPQDGATYYINNE